MNVEPGTVGRLLNHISQVATWPKYPRSLSAATEIHPFAGSGERHGDVVWGVDSNSSMGRGRRSDRKVVPDNGTGRRKSTHPRLGSTVCRVCQTLWLISPARLPTRLATRAGRPVATADPCARLMDHHMPLKGMDRHKESPRLNVPFRTLKRQGKSASWRIMLNRQGRSACRFWSSTCRTKAGSRNHAHGSATGNPTADERTCSMGSRFERGTPRDPPRAIRLGLLPDLDFPIGKSAFD